jgi:RHS repeat-associated protein
VWRWDQAEPFGNTPANEDPDANSVAFDLQLRLPGQRYDQETGLHYNYFRDYDPSLGRYGESDPIGLRAGLNTYAYVAGQPLSLLDPQGLFGIGTHVDISRQALQIECPKLAGGAAHASGGLSDFGDNSQDPVNARRHCMRTPGEDSKTAEGHFNEWVMSQLKQCSVLGLGKALHATQDCYPTGHQGYEPWHGSMTWDHLKGDAVGGRNAAIEASKALIRRFKAMCPCMCS